MPNACQAPDPCNERGRRGPGHPRVKGRWTPETGLGGHCSTQDATRDVWSGWVGTVGLGYQVIGNAMRVGPRTAG